MNSFQKSSVYGGEEKKAHQIKFLKQFPLLIWKSYLQRTRRWPLVAVHTVFSGLLFLMAVYTAKPVFLTPLQPTPEAPLTYGDIMATLSSDIQIGFAPAEEPYLTVMNKVAMKLNKVFWIGSSEGDLNELLHKTANGTLVKNHVIWVIWKEKEGNVWRFSIRSSKLAHLGTSPNATVTKLPHNRHLRVGFLAVQLAVSEALLEYESQGPIRHTIKLKSMPMSPLMQKEVVSQAMVWILLCYTLAFIPPVMEVAALAVQETVSEYKRALFIHSVSASCIYMGWLTYLLLTALPVLILATLALILIFRWVQIFLVFGFLLIYITLMTMTAFIIAMFQNKPYLAAIWSASFTLLQLFLADLLVHHGFDSTTSMTILLHIVLPPLGLVHGLHEFALLQTGREGLKQGEVYGNNAILIWIAMIIIYWGLLMMLQRTIGNGRAIGGQVSWKSIIFKQAESSNKLHVIATPTGNERDKLQKVDEFIGKAISFYNVTKSVMGVPVLRKLTFDVYRGEYTVLFGERIQQQMLGMLEDLICGSTPPNEGTVNILGQDMTTAYNTGKCIMNELGMTGICHRSTVLVDELTVAETLRFFAQISLWYQQGEETERYLQRQMPKLLKECALLQVKHTYVRNLVMYYRAQLCWAIAMLLEPRVILIQSSTWEPNYSVVIDDKIVTHRTHRTIVKLSDSTALLVNADRVFLFDSEMLVFGGSPAYMFFKFGREYRVRMTFRSRGSLDNQYAAALIDYATSIGGQVRSYVGTLLILRMPTTPTKITAEFVNEITMNSSKYGITSLNISLPDSEEIFKRAISDSSHKLLTPISIMPTDTALRNLARQRVWKRVDSLWLTSTLFKQMVWKYISFYIHYRLFLIITVMAAIVTGAIIGVYLSVQLASLAPTISSAKLQSGELLTVESLEQSTTLVLKVDNTADAISIATAYAMSHTAATEKQIKNMAYTALRSTESITEYLVLRAIDSPQHYVYAYAYGMRLKDLNETLEIIVLYSPIHHDTAAAARSLARVYTALLRHYTGRRDADIQVTDDPLALDSSPIQTQLKVPPLVIHFLLIVTISHMTLLPTMEHGLIRHSQSHAMNFSPASYWFCLFCCDILLYWTLVCVISTVLFCVMYWTAPVHFLHRDLIIIPFMLLMFGLSCVPQAYLFSLGPNAALNLMSFIIFNIIFGEASVISQFIHGKAFTYAERALSLSPQYNVANAFVRLSKIFVYNSECVIFNNMKLCTSNVFHKCCKKCGIMQACFERISYLSYSGILGEILWTVYHSIIFSSLLILWEYKIVHRFWRAARNWWFYLPPSPAQEVESGEAPTSLSREKKDVANKLRQIIRKSPVKEKQVDTFGEHLLVDNLTMDFFGGIIKGVSFGLAKGEALALVGTKENGRLRLCKLLAGLQIPSNGTAIAMSKWALQETPHNYARHVSFSRVDFSALPPWMTVYDGLWMIAVMRGVPLKYVEDEVTSLLEALELGAKSNTNVFRLHQNEQTRLNFAAAVIGAPPILILDEFNAYQENSVDRAMFYILYHLRKQGHALLVSSASVENNMPLTRRLAVLFNGRLLDVDHVDSLVARYGNLGYTVVVHLKDEVNVEAMFARHFTEFTLNDVADVLANVQIMDDLDYAQIFGKMEELQQSNEMVYAYIISVTPMDYIYNKILSTTTHHFQAVPPVLRIWNFLQGTVFDRKKNIDIPSMVNLKTFEKKYDITSLKELPWSVIFRR